MIPFTDRFLISEDRKIPWRDILPKDWNLIPLKYLANINRMALPENTDPEFIFKYIDIGSVNSLGKINKTEELTFADAPSRARRVVSTGDVIISTVRTYLKAIAFCNQINEDTICSTGFAVLSPKIGVVPKFLFYWVRSSSFIDEIVSRSTGVSYPAVNAAEIGSLPFPALDEETQRMIVSFLDIQTALIDELIVLKEKQIELLEIKRQATISQAVTYGLDSNAPMKPSGVHWLGDIPVHWQLFRLKYLSNKIGSGRTPRGGAEIYSDEGVIFLRSQNVYDDGLRLQDVVYIDETIDQEMADTRVQDGDVLLNITGASIGRTCVVPEGFPGANVNQHVCIIRPKKAKVLNHFLAYCLKATSMKDQINSLENGSSRQGLNFEQIGNLLVVSPTNVDEQQAIVNYLDEATANLDKTIKSVKTQIDLLQHYRQTLITYAVTGKIDIRGVNV